MFLRKIDYLNDDHCEQLNKMTARCQHSTNSNDNTTTATVTSSGTCSANIKQFLIYMNDIITSIKEWDEKLFTNKNDHWEATKQIDKHYNDLFDAFYYFTFYTSKTNEGGNTINEHSNSNNDNDNYKCASTSYAIMKWPICNMEITNINYDWDDIDIYEDSSSMSGLECSNYNRLHSTTCSINKEFTFDATKSLQFSEEQTFATSSS